MSLRMLPAACAAAAALACAAQAWGAEPVTARLVQPLAAPVKLIAGGAMFVCRDDVCVAQAPGSRTLSAAACRAVAKAFGPVTAFGDPRRGLEGDKLADCNAAAPEQTRFAKR